MTMIKPNRRKFIAGTVALGSVSAGLAVPAQAQDFAPTQTMRGHLLWNGSAAAGFG